MTVKYKHEFTKRIAKAPVKIRTTFAERGRIFVETPFHPLLNNHRLTGKYAGCRSIDITGDWRAIFREFNNYELVIFETIGTHSQLYK